MSTIKLYKEGHQQIKSLRINNRPVHFTNGLGEDFLVGKIEYNWHLRNQS